MSEENTQRELSEEESKKILLDTIYEVLPVVQTIADVPGTAGEQAIRFSVLLVAGELGLERIRKSTGLENDALLAEVRRMISVEEEER